MSPNPVKPSRNLLVWGILLPVIASFAVVSAIAVNLSLPTVILILVAFVEAVLIILGLVIPQHGQEAAVVKMENVRPVTTMSRRKG
jgi:hypothetical protein